MRSLYGEKVKLSSAYKVLLHTKCSLGLFIYHQHDYNQGLSSIHILLQVTLRNKKKLTKTFANYLKITCIIFLKKKNPENCQLQTTDHIHGKSQKHNLICKIQKKRQIASVKGKVITYIWNRYISIFPYLICLLDQTII